ncbi:methyltransferase [Mytilinidion resinicola]|uniref:Methyltransferase n=1 Tax=Mytilinidion resinicola TaxID=574789 RepID=A0A6A6YF34_9PEZI|nr:methyltransferase [Mytilinidion resinicola]KAF2807188.1 methyltransferase [Mytilinidion resinicola]
MAEQTAPPLDPNPQYDPPADLKSRMKASYDAIAPKYNEWTVSHSATRLRYLDQLLSRLPTTTSPSAPVSVLELGAGCGLPVTQKLLAHANLSVTANDISSAQLSIARANLLPDDPPGPAHGRLTLLDGDMLALDFAPAVFDAVVGMYSIIHLPRAEQVEMLRKIVAWLKPGGWLLANFAADEFAGAEAQNWLEEEKGWMFWSGWGSEGTLEKVREAGLEVVVRETVEDLPDEKFFLWILAKKSES